MKFKYSIFALLAINSSLLSQEVILDKMSVTATKIQRATKEVTQSISVVDDKEIDDKNIITISEAINTIPGVNVESSTNSSSPRLIIRGAGLKARYGVREIMVIKDGVPMTDPDSFTRFDFIDMQDVESIEVQKGPGSILAANATGGVIQLISKSVFDESKNRVKFGIGTFGATQSNIRFGSSINENDFMSLNLSTTKNDNDWRKNNDINSSQASIKYGHIFDDESTIESELSYTKSNMQLPASMTKSEFDEFLSTGEQELTTSPWQNSARNSEIFFFNTKYEKTIGDITYKPRVYYTSWDHFHPVTAFINDATDNSVYGIDFEVDYNHKLFSNDAVLVSGITVKQDVSNNAKKYTYSDYIGTGSITQTLSDNIGDLANIEDSKSTLYGIYFQESFSPTQKTLLDLSLRVDKLKFDVSGNELLVYNWSAFGTSAYKTGDGEYSMNEEYTLVSPKLGGSYALNDTTNIYASIASSNQAPTGSEIMTNQSYDKEILDKTSSINYEIGLKARANDYSYDIALYQNDIKDEVIATKEGYTTYYQNAGETQKRGLELNSVYNLTKNFSFGASYSYSNFKFKEFMEEGTYDRSENYLPYIPKHQYSIYTSFNYKGFKSRIQARSWGSYYMDNANTEKYGGYDFVTDLMLGYEKSNHSIQLNVNNVFDKYYAMSAQKDIDGELTYKAAAPRTAMLTYSYKF